MPEDVVAAALTRRQQNRDEYSKYVAAEEVRKEDGTVVYGRGWPVPAGNVLADGRIILARHMCDGKDPVTGEDCPIPHNEVTEVSDAGAAVAVGGQKSAAKGK